MQCYAEEEEEEEEEDRYTDFSDKGYFKSFKTTSSTY